MRFRATLLAVLAAAGAALLTGTVVGGCEGIRAIRPSDDAGVPDSGEPDAGHDAGHDAGPGVMCDPTALYVYVVATDNTLWRFDPPTLTFMLVGKLNCPSAASPESMAIDRSGVAWVEFSDGTLYNVSTTTAVCTGTSFLPGQDNFITFGMGFSSDTDGGDVETLYLTGSGPLDPATKQATAEGLASVDLSTLTVNPVGQYTGLTAPGVLASYGELTGTGDGRLFALFAETSAVIAQIDKTNATILTQIPQSVISETSQISAIAFSFWGGNFWLFIGSGAETNVYEYNTTTKVTTLRAIKQFLIVGAGVSTCAPMK